MMGRSMMGMQDCPMMGGSGQGMMGSEMMAGGATSGPHPSSSGTRSRGKRRVLGQIIDDLCRPSLE